ncbi:MULTISPECIES: glycoside hydrolase family 53 protein [unclassified Cryobacterium]|uniref:glycoside hydrolase family 53 protein n=1 Tax=unclassified Cryobacterium TaxID=2649013 RepID=UPI002AB4FF67|nr:MULTISPECIES: glycosyl hydrolase 53 family protein [unclassified Cryobacterium]MDY7541186.1 glycosyl hydrolase 53 family protein [Cryobacterium sp. 5B3]MEA9998936.1 glycosyl hydrolase 53 family protein [Cryobacterium sp. RTS3]MEB0267963.1 glycosyl hydrolase 53 family protein [Cryobacterium sp. 10I5]MEB0274243.1 glycosyl hydrolase 53 family protein [Cryobacterium sp. 5B3]
MTAWPPVWTRRRAILAGTAVLTVSAIVGTGMFVAAASRVSPGSLRIRGADVSFALQTEAAGTRLSDAGQVLPVEQILANHGATYLRVRVWVDPAPGTSDLAAALTLARRAAAAGLHIVLDLHYSDTWADRTNQQTPAAWQSLGPDQLAATVEDYTRDVLTAFEAQGTPADIVQLGNEITNGMLWPTGWLAGTAGDDWTHFDELLRAAERGAHSTALQHPPAVMIHVDTGVNVELSTRFFDHLVGAGIPFDLIGVTFYPFWHGSLPELQNLLNSLAWRYEKDIVIAETSYPWTLANADGTANIVSTAAQLPEAALYPPTEAGQRAYFQALRAVLLSVPGGHGAGFLDWEPAWLAGVGISKDIGNAYDNLTLFDAAGRGIAALDGFAPP